MAELTDVDRAGRPVVVHGRYWNERLGKMCGRSVASVIVADVTPEALGVRWWDAEERRTVGDIRWLRLGDITEIVPMDGEQPD